MLRRGLEDCFAGLSGVLFLALVIGAIHLLADLDRLAKLWMSHWVALLLFGVGVVALTTAMWLWMVADCAVQVAKGRRQHLLWWLAVMSVVSPAAWPYYFIERRKRGSTHMSSAERDRAGAMAGGDAAPASRRRAHPG